MRSMVNEIGQVVAEVRDDGTLLNERHQHRVRSFARLHRPLFWQHTGKPVKLHDTSGQRLKRYIENNSPD